MPTYLLSFSSALQQYASRVEQVHMVVVSQEKFIKVIKTNKQSLNSCGVFLFGFVLKANKFLYPIHTEIPKQICQCNCTTIELMYTGTKCGQTGLNNLD